MGFISFLFPIFPFFNPSKFQYRMPFSAKYQVLHTTILFVTKYKPFSMRMQIIFFFHLAFHIWFEHLRKERMKETTENKSKKMLSGIYSVFIAYFTKIATTKIRQRNVNEVCVFTPFHSRINFFFSTVNTLIEYHARLGLVFGFGCHFNCFCNIYDLFFVHSFESMLSLSSLMILSHI